MANSNEFIAYSNNPVIDEGLRNFMLKVYNYMAGGLCATALVAYLVISNVSIFRLFFNENGYTGLGYLALFSPLILIFAFNWVLQEGTLRQVSATFWTYSALMGISLAPIFLVYTGVSVARVFLTTAAAFGALSLYGYTTKKNLNGWGSFLFIGLFGVIIASIVNFFLKSTGMSYTISYITIFVFAGLTAYDTQMLKSLYFRNTGVLTADTQSSYVNSIGEEMTSKIAVSGALSLYLDFINMFLALLRLFGDRR